MTRRTEMERLSPDDPRYEDAARIADAVLSGQTPDPTAGATHFLNPTVVRQRRGGSLPSWAQGEGQPIGRHTFYYPNEDTTGRAALSMGDLADPHVYDTSSQPLTEAVGFRSRAHVLSRNWRNGRRRYAISDAFGD
jgi:Cell Wall Hydrolase